jgi:hypothetical protein
VYVEWDQRHSVGQADDPGDASYTLTGTAKSATFEIQARAQPKLGIRVYNSILAVQNNRQGSVIALGWPHGGQKNFILSGSEGRFSSSNPPVDWKHSNLASLGDRTLRTLSIPGAHDAGMSGLSSHTFFVKPASVLTQTPGVGDQLAAGARYSDLRPVISAGQFRASHYSHVDPLNGWQGINGQAGQGTIQEVNAFTATHAELVILNLFHDLNTDVGNAPSRLLSEPEWNKVIELILDLRSLFVAPNASRVHLSTLPWTQYIGNWQAAVVVIVEISGVDLGPYTAKGFRSPQQLRPNSSHSDSDKLGVMIQDRIQKMKTLRTSADAGYFLLSWTRAQDPGDAVKLGPAILSLASDANPVLDNQLLSSSAREVLPTIIYIDGVTATRYIAALAMAVSNNAGG